MPAGWLNQLLGVIRPGRLSCAGVQVGAGGAWHDSCSLLCKGLLHLWPLARQVLQGLWRSHRHVWLCRCRLHCRRLKCMHMWSHQRLLHAQEE